MDPVSYPIDSVQSGHRPVALNASPSLSRGNQRKTVERADSIVVLDFETTGLSPAQGDRAIEIGAVRLQDGQIVETFQRLMNPGIRVNPFIESYTGITNHMLRNAQSCHEVMADFVVFLGCSNVVAHNASFDKRFLDAELRRIGETYSGSFVCSMLVARRVCDDAHNHRLATLVDHLNIDIAGDFHRALADSEMTACVWVKMLDEISSRYAPIIPTFPLMQRLSRTPKNGLRQLFEGAIGDQYNQIN
jgi:DNA polymerase III subunit epsilon